MMRDAAEVLMDRVRESGLLTPRAIVFEPGGFRNLGAYAWGIAPVGPIFVVTHPRDATHEMRAFVEDQFAGHDVRAVHYGAVEGEPTAAEINRLAGIARRVRPTMTIGIGGGSAVDAAKAVAALATNPGDVEDYLEGHHRRRALESAPVPMVAVPTTAGTGAEMTRNAVICCPQRHFKRSLRNDRMVPAMALIDPDLTLDLPAEITASGGMDAVTQLIESCITRKRRPEVTALALAALRWPREALPLCASTPQDREARTAMSLAASVSGVCLANAGLAMAHGIAAALGAWHGMRHGLACGILLPHTLRYNRHACAPELAAALGSFLGERKCDEGTIDRGIMEIAALNRTLGLPPDLKHLQLKPEEVETLAAASLGSSMSGNPIPMTEEDVRRFLEPLV